MPYRNIKANPQKGDIIKHVGAQWGDTLFTVTGFTYSGYTLFAVCKYLLYNDSCIDYGILMFRYELLLFQRHSEQIEMFDI